MNLLKMIPILLNRVAKNEIELNNIDFSPYQAKSEKNQPNGYLGLDNNSRVLSNKYLTPKNKLAFLSDSALSTPAVNTWTTATNGGGGSFSTNGTTNTVKIKNSNSTILYAPTLTLANSVTGYVAILANREIVNIYSPFKVYAEIKLALLKNSTKQNKLSVGLGAYQGLNGVWNSSGLVITIDPTVNNGNYQYGKILSGTATLLNHTTTITEETLTSFIIEYDKLTETANFYIDYQLIGVLTNVNIPNNINMREAISFYSGDATETNTRRVSIFSNNIEFDLES